MPGDQCTCTRASHADAVVPDGLKVECHPVVVFDGPTSVGIVTGRHRSSSVTGGRPTSSTDGYIGWVVVFGCFVAQALTIGSTYTFGIIFVELLEEFGHSRAVTAWIGSIQTTFLYLTGIFVGPLIKIHGGRTVAIFGTLISTIGFIGSAWVTNIYQLFFTYGIVTGVGNGLVYVSSSVVFHYHFDKWRTLANGVVVTGSGVGTLGFALIMQTLIKEIKWRSSLMVEGAIMLIGILCAALYLAPPTTIDIDQRPSEKQPLLTRTNGSLRTATATATTATTPAAATAALTQTVTSSTGRLIGCHEDESNENIISPNERLRSFLAATFGHLSLLRCRPYALLVISNFLFSFGYHVPYAYAPNRAQRVAGVDANDAALLVSIMGGASVLGRLLGGLTFISCQGWLRGGQNRGCVCSSSTVRLVVAVVVMIGSGLTSALSFEMINFTSMIVYATLIGVFGGVWASVYGVVVIDVMGVGNVANAIGLAMAFSSISILVAAPLTGWIINKMDGDFNVAFAVLGLIQVVGGIVAALSPFFATTTETGEETAVILPTDLYSGTDVVSSRSRSIHTMS